MTEVEIYEVLGFVSHITPKVAADDAVPCRALSLVKLYHSSVSLRRQLDMVLYSPLDVLGNVLLDAELAHGFLSCRQKKKFQSHGYDSHFEILPSRVDLPTSMASCCMSSVYTR